MATEVSEVTVRPGRPGLCVVVSYPGGEQPLALSTPDDTCARIDLVYVHEGDRMLGVATGTPMPPPLQAPEPPDGAEVLAGVLVRPVFVARGDIIAPEKLKP